MHMSLISSVVFAPAALSALALGRAGFDHVERAGKAVPKHISGASAIVALERLERDLKVIAEDAVIAKNTTEFCACLAAYPSLRGEKAAYEATQ
ncbi:MAG: hypothetical protein ABJ327_17210 [Litoreibacter sp.]